MPPPTEITIKSEIPANFFTEENLKFLDEVLDEVDFSSDSEFSEKVITPEPPVFSDLFLDSDYAEFFAISSDKNKWKLEKKKLEESKHHIKKSLPRSGSSSRRKRRSKEERSRSRDKYKSRSPRGKIKQGRRSSSEYRRKAKQSKRTPSREGRRNRRKSRKNNRSKRDRGRSRSNERRRNSHSRRSRNPTEKLPFLEEVKKNLAAKGQSFAEIEEFERYQKRTVNMENTYLNSKSTSVSSPYPPLSIYRHSSTELQPGNCIVPFQDSSPDRECMMNEPSTSKQLRGILNNNFIN